MTPQCDASHRSVPPTPQPASRTRSPWPKRRLPPRTLRSCVRCAAIVTCCPALAPRSAAIAATAFPRPRSADAAARPASRCANADEASDEHSRSGQPVRRRTIEKAEMNRAVLVGAPQDPVVVPALVVVLDDPRPRGVVHTRFDTDLRDHGVRSESWRTRRRGSIASGRRRSGLRQPDPSVIIGASGVMR